MDILVAIGAIFAAVGGLTGLGSMLTVRSQKRKIAAEGEKDEADAVRILSNTAVELLEPARKQVKSLREDLAAAEAKVAMLTDQLDLARQEAKELRADLAQVRKEAEARITELARQLQAAQAQLDQMTKGGPP